MQKTRMVNLETPIFIPVDFTQRMQVWFNFVDFLIYVKVRTDRSLPFYDGDDNPNVNVLRDILLTYSFYNFDLGYCQVIYYLIYCVLEILFVLVFTISKLIILALLVVF